ncbi:MAG: EscU/YscU/HrcU family type III secretion system export apparatus switch protein [Clostridiales bacterium]|jgi:flagellar biosynthesis protein|nr:EscU/YscU/HrcU family type III secretion system export apparatus switch protein [Clostridiales bacterium]
MKKEKVDLKKKAVALQYKLGFSAPKVVATGSGHLAHKIMETAKEADVKLYQDAKLVEDLVRLDLGMEIPPELYQVVAQILVYIDNLDALEAMRSYDGSQ